MPRTRKLLVVLLVLGALTMGTAIAIDKRPDSPGPGASSEELVEAARQTYEVLKKNLRRSEPEDLYLWSKRWMTAEWDLGLAAGEAPKAVREHYARMLELETITVALHEAAQLSAEKVAATKYYRTEAELMLARTGG
ncbi:MAG TPA: hypothetical protein VHC22_05345 [Pirellulales bacterium]|nr:hypothetical protein [Pirellulales bacterium]